MAVLALGLGAPQSVCVAVQPDPAKTCCCTESPICKCQPGLPCRQACTLVRAPSLDKQAPARVVEACALSPQQFLYSIVPVAISSFALNCPIRSWSNDAALPRSSSPPQAVLCLWRV